MLPSERQRRIKELIRDRGNLRISELSELLGVSEMTVHRDIKPLVEEGFIIKTFGGITLVREEPGKVLDDNDCVFCSRRIDQRLAYRLILPNNRVESACCAHCGLLRHQQLGDQVIQAICFDFFSNTTISSSSAWFVVDTAIDIGCCQPQILTFARKDYAEGVVKGFGGCVLSFDKAIESVNGNMRSEREGCCTKQGQAQ
ncbi:DeoR family transcriptional regulator [Effusibacillus consociatus]|uniref:DeoR family transcriptional regulator n=1 Tax=Effusibacillus consociatus TaxID=1117041 RepID=UPI0036D3324C